MDGSGAQKVRITNVTIKTVVLSERNVFLIVLKISYDTLC